MRFPAIRRTVMSLCCLAGPTIAIAQPAPVIAQPASVIAQPSVTAIENNYSYILPASPNYGIAQGSLFVIFGKDLASASTGLQPFPLETAVSGTSLTVRVDGITTHPIPYYVSPGQIAAILPSATPVGVGVLRVTSNGATSAPTFIQVVRTDFGIDTLYGAGYGPAVAQHANGQILGPTNSANPGETIVLWGSGVGPDPDNDQITYPQKQNNLTGLPMEVDIGGIPAAISYRGRSPYPGVDQINVTVPANVPPGCWVSAVVWTENYSSNFATIPIAANGSTCSDLSTGYSGTELAGLLSQPSLNIGTIGIGNYAPPVTFTGTGYDAAIFNTYTPAEFIASLILPVTYNTLVFADTGVLPYIVGLTAVSIGSCVVVQEPQTYTHPAALNAGLINLSQSGGAVVTDNGSGGSQVGPFQAQATIPSGFSWQGSSVDWLSGLTVTWSDAAPDSFVQIYGLSSNAGTGLYTAFTCSAPAGAGIFAVPSVVLRAMAPYAELEADGNINPYFLAVSNYTYPEAFTATGIDFGTIYGYTALRN